MRRDDEARYKGRVNGDRDEGHVDPDGPRLVGLAPRIHLFVDASLHDDFVVLFRDVLHQELSERDFGLPYPITLVTFPDRSSFSVEWTERADGADDEAVPAGEPGRGTWIEFRTRDLAATLADLRRAGVPEFRHDASPHAYFRAPGGQVFRVIDIDYRGP